MVPHALLTRSSQHQDHNNTCIMGWRVGGLLCREGGRAADGGMLEGIQLGSEGGELLPLLSPPEGGLLSCQPHCCIIQLSLYPNKERVAETTGA